MEQRRNSGGSGQGWKTVSDEIVKIRNAGEKLGFEKIIIKNGLMICFFISNPMSKYYKSERFASLLSNISSDRVFELKQNDNRLKIIVKNVHSLEKAYELLKKLL